jgi:hypothetical protein
MAHFHSRGFDRLCGVCEARRRPSSLQGSWKSSFLFAVVVIVLVIFDHVLAFDQPVAIRFVHIVVLLVVLVILGSWFFSTRGMNRSGTLLGWDGGVRLIAVAFAMMVVVALAIVLPAHVFLSNHFSTSP